MNLPPPLIKAWQVGETDPAIFVEGFLSPKGKKLQLNKPQTDWLLKSDQDLNVWAAGNSTGKSWGEALKHIWYATYKIKYRAGSRYHYQSTQEWMDQPYETLCTAPDYKQAMIVWQQIESFFRFSQMLNMTTWVKDITVATRRDPHARIELANGSIIHATSTANRGKHIEGQAYDMISFDEPADEMHLNHVVERVLRPRTFRRGGMIDLVGTPKGVGEFFDYWRMGMKYEKDGYYSSDDGLDNPLYSEKVYSQRSDSMENPYASGETMEEFASLHDPDMIKERLHGIFVDSGDTVFKLAEVEAIMKLDSEEIEGTNGNYREFEAGHTYVGGVDFGQLDSTVLTILDTTYVPYQLVVQEEYANHSWEYIFAKFLELHRRFKQKVTWQIDATAMGGSMQEEWTRGLGIRFYPFTYNPVSKVKLINTLQEVIGSGRLVTPIITDLREQLRFYRLDPKTRKIDDAKQRTDRIQSLALAVELAERKRPVPEIYYYGAERAYDGI